MKKQNKIKFFFWICYRALSSVDVSHPVPPEPGDAAMWGVASRQRRCCWWRPARTWRPGTPRAAPRWAGPPARGSSACGRAFVHMCDGPRAKDDTHTALLFVRLGSLGLFFPNCLQLRGMLNLGGCSQGGYFKGSACGERRHWTYCIYFYSITML